MKTTMKYRGYVLIPQGTGGGVNINRDHEVIDFAYGIEQAKHIIDSWLDAE